MITCRAARSTRKPTPPARERRSIDKECGSSMNRAEPRGQVAVATHREPRPRCVVNAAVGGSQRREHRPDKEQDHKRHRIGQPCGIEQRRYSLAEIFPRHQPRADIPRHRRRDKKRDDAGHRAERQRSRGRSNLFSRLTSSLDAEIVPEAEVKRRNDPKPAVRQPVQHVLMIEQLVRPGLDRCEQNDDRDEGNAVSTRLTVSVA